MTIFIRNQLLNDNSDLKVFSRSVKNICAENSVNVCKACTVR